MGVPAYHDFMLPLLRIAADGQEHSISDAMDTLAVQLVIPDADCEVMLPSGTIYVQAKKWDNSVGPGEIDRFVGSLMRKRATKGVFITSGTFTEGAHRAAREAAVKVRLIDGDELADLMIDFSVGVALNMADVFGSVVCRRQL